MQRRAETARADRVPHAPGDRREHAEPGRDVDHRNTFVEPKARARAIGVWGAVVGVAMALGPLVGGGLTQLSAGVRSSGSTCRSALAAIVLAQLFVPESRAPRARRLDPVGQLLVLGALAAVTYAVIEGPHARLGLAA